MVSVGSAVTTATIICRSLSELWISNQQVLISEPTNGLFVASLGGHTVRGTVVGPLGKKIANFCICRNLVFWAKKMIWKNGILI